MARSILLKLLLIFSLATCSLLLLLRLRMCLPPGSCERQNGKTLRETLASLREDRNWSDVLVFEDETDDEIFGRKVKQKKMCWSPPKRKVTSVSCLSLMEGDETELKAAETADDGIGSTLSLVTDCRGFRSTAGYDNLGRCIVTQEEESFPVAFSIVVHSDAAQVERLLRAIYRPHNFYCIHVDQKADPEFFRTLSSVAGCFDNVFLTEKREDIVYAHYTRLKADLNCMEDLLSRSSSWKYLINLTGQMFPLKTNREIVKILSTLRGTNDIEGFSWYKSKGFYFRYEKSHEVIQGRLEVTDRFKSPPPMNVTILKGSAFGSFSREFVEYVLTDRKVKVFLEWLRDTYSPDEFFWPTVNSRYVNPMFNAPGSYDGAPERLPWLSAFASWFPRDKCRGLIVRGVCIFGVGDLQQLTSRPEMFANKFYSRYQPLALDCLEEWIHNKTFSPQPFPVFAYLERHYYVHPDLEV